MRSPLITPALLAVLAASPALAHDGHFSAGKPGDPKKPSRTVVMIMSESNSGMAFTPHTIEVRKGEQIRFLLRNNGELDHEFMLASKADNDKHAEVMKKFPDMQHDDANGKRLSPKGSSEILWRFTKAGEFEFACLIPGHREAGMHGKVLVK